MTIDLKKDLCFFDLETTGLNVIRDRIIQIAIVKIDRKDHSRSEYYKMINPGPVFISEEAASVHGITNEMVKNKPTFLQLAKEILDFIGDSDLVGYNSNRFDVPLLMEEFARAGFDFDMEKRRTVDVQQIFYKMEPRTLKAAYRYYCGKEMKDAHDALADVNATLEVFESQLDFYEGKDLVDENGDFTKNPIVRDIEALHLFTTNLNSLDATQRLKLNKDGVVVFNFGKYVDQSVIDIFKKEKGYYNWMMSKDFSQQVKNIITKIYQEEIIGKL
ncbi:MAG: 3'-5' exonuclease [Saprospiraceae bacterium]|jgi:DNA polymerase-3 subunit epsilon|nr:3'-5' exonuclease [Saprospiraceae bacterium]MCA0334645.1 3'-5' exonuclease [Bacteroidota bacterium]MCB0604748.1 3'-5' exonuclease [Saprospiraceae bacterium]HQU95781.1 3'-5' exonuclease [Saprospiraceae bacterium]